MIFKYLNNSFQNFTQESELVVGHKAVVWQLQLSILLKEYRIVFPKNVIFSFLGKKQGRKCLELEVKYMKMYFNVPILINIENMINMK